MENAIRILHEAGFDAYDWSMGPMEKEPDHELNQPNYREYAHHIRKFADSLGIVCNQAHAPTPSSYEDPTKTAALREAGARVFLSRAGNIYATSNGITLTVKH